MVLDASITQVCGELCKLGRMALFPSASDGLHATGQQVNPGELAALSKGQEVALCECGWA